MTDTTTDEGILVTDEQAELLAQHAIHVQGGYSTPEVERERALSDLRAGGMIDWTKVQTEVDAAIAAKIAASPAPSTPLTASEEVEATEPVTHAQRVDVTAVLANVDAGEALRDRIKELQKQLKIHEDAIKDVLGPAVEGVDATGAIVVRYPYRNRSDLDRKLVKTMLSDDEYAKAVRETTYRTLLYGE
jgi:hypothetical protein